MSTSSRCRVLSTPTKSASFFKGSQKREEELVKFRYFSNEILFWMMASAFLSLEVTLLKGAVLRIFSQLICPLDADIAYLVEAPLLILSVANAVCCLCAALKKGYFSNTSVDERGCDRMLVSAASNREKNVLSEIERTSVSSPYRENKDKNDRRFSFNWLSALQFGSFRNAWKPRSGNISSEISKSRISSYAERASSILNSSGLLSNFESALQSGHSFDNGGDHSLEAEVGSRTSPFSKITSSVQTTKQLENLIENTSGTNSSSLYPEGSGSSSYYSSHGLQKQTIFSVGNHYPILTSGSSGYELGTSFTDDDHVKNVNDENGVISLVTGSRIKVSTDRVSLSPIPLNLLKTTAELAASDDGTSSSEKGTVDRINRNRNDVEDSTAFRIEHNAVRKSPRKSSMYRRSESWERRRAVSISPISNTSSSPFSSAFSSADNSSPNLLGKQISLSSAEILNQYKIDADQFLSSERFLRSWICGTIVRPLISNIDKMNAIFLKEYPLLHLKIGRSTVQALQSALSSKPDLFSTPLPYLIPYLKVHEKQSYVVRRARTLSGDLCMKEYNWQSGGGEFVEETEQDNHSYSPKESPWGEHLPTDAQLIWSWFSSYLDARMAANSMAGDLQTPFSSVYFLKKPSKPCAVQCAPDSFYIHQVSIHPPQFELVVEGGRERFEMSRGPKNLWRTILLFLQHARLFNNNRIGELAIDETGINISRILE